ncbi:hypothetical protein SJS52_16615 [Aeromonas veronii]|nr:hypothetical protein [Aeromonas veronii]MDX7747089.1 hypothetical protein [Aeromonas veronii]
MNLSLVSQNVSAASEGLLAILRSSPEYGDHFAHITVTPLAQWQPAKTEAAILLIDGDAPGRMPDLPEERMRRSVYLSCRC